MCVDTPIVLNHNFPLGSVRVQGWCVPDPPEAGTDSTSRTPVLVPTQVGRTFLRQDRKPQSPPPRDGPSTTEQPSPSTLIPRRLGVRRAP